MERSIVQKIMQLTEIHTEVSLLLITLRLCCF
jgi:hypothetical protein